MSRRRSPRQRRDAARRRRLAARGAELRAWLKAQPPCPWEPPAVLELAAEFGVTARAWPDRYPDGVEAAGDGWLVLGTLAEVRAELEQRCRC